MVNRKFYFCVLINVLRHRRYYNYATYLITFNIFNHKIPNNILNRIGQQTSTSNLQKKQRITKHVKVTVMSYVMT